MRTFLITAALCRARASEGLKSWKHRARVATTLAVVAALPNLSATAALATPARANAADAGEVVLVGSVTVDGVTAVSGQTLFTGSTLATAERSSSALSLGNLARLELSAETTLKLDFSESNVGGVLDAGRVRVYVPAGLAGSLETAGAAVLTDASQPAVFSVAVEKGKTIVSVERGRVEMRAGGGARTFAAGEAFSAAEGSSPEPHAAQSWMDDRKRLWAGVGIAAGLAVLIVAVTGRGDDEEELDFGCGPIVGISDIVDVPCQ